MESVVKKTKGTFKYLEKESIAANFTYGIAIGRDRNSDKENTDSARCG